MTKHIGRTSFAIFFAAMNALVAGGMSAGDILAGDIVSPPSALQDAVNQLATAAPDWSVHEVDQEPSVAVNGQRGYRVVLRRTWKEPPTGFQFSQVASFADETGDSTFITKHEDWDFVLFPTSAEQLPDDAKRQIRWHVPDENYYRLPIALGEGRGFTWFTYSNIPLQHHIREHLELTGGDDPLQVVLMGLGVRDEGTMTRNSVMWLFAKFGDRGYAALEKVIDERIGSGLAKGTDAIAGLGHFRDDKATRKLIDLYGSWDQDYQQAAAYALIHKPFRPEAKSVYFDLVSKQVHVQEAIQACVEFHWDDALPIIAKVVDRPSSIGAYRAAYSAFRELSGSPIEPVLLEAQKVILEQNDSGRTEDEVEAARRAILESSDREGAVFVAVCLANFTSKGGAGPARQDGRQLLRALPQDLVRQAMDRLSIARP